MCVLVLAVASIVTNVYQRPLVSLTTTIAGVCHWCMMMDPGNVDFYRYADWFMSTPVLTYNILRESGVSTWTTAGLLLCDVMMIVSGYLGESATDVQDRCMWFMLGMCFYMPLCFFFYSIVWTCSKAWLIFTLYTGYPIVWLLVDKEQITKVTADRFYSALDLSCKLGLALMLE